MNFEQTQAAAAAFGGTGGADRALRCILLLAKWDPTQMPVPQALHVPLAQELKELDVESPQWRVSHPGHLVGDSTAPAGAPPRRMYLNALSDLYTDLRLSNIVCLRAVRAVMPIQHAVRHVQEVITFVNGRIQELYLKSAPLSEAQPSDAAAGASNS